MSLTQELIALIRAKTITDEDLQQAALFTLDAIACAYAGSNTPVGEILQRWAAQGARYERDWDRDCHGCGLGGLFATT